MSVSEIQVRLQQLTDTVPYGAEARQILQRLSIFLTERFGGPILKVLLSAYDRETQIRIVNLLQEHRVLHKRTRGNGRNDWWEAYKPWDTLHLYWIDPQVSAFLWPDPSEQEQIFAAYAAYLFRTGTGISKDRLDIYIDLVDWAQQHRPEISLEIAYQAASRYGGTDTRLYERMYQAAQKQKQISRQIKAAFWLGRTASQQQRLDLSAAWYQRILELGMPEFDVEIAFHHIHALEHLGHLARATADWAQARTFYERALDQRRRINPQKPIHLDRLLWLCRITEKQGDTAARERYGKEVQRTWRGWLHQLEREMDMRARARNPISQQRDLFAVTLRRQADNRRGTGDILWHWGRFEYIHGDHAAGRALCQMGILDLERQLEALIIQHISLNHAQPYTLVAEREGQYLEELKQGLRLMEREKHI